SRSRGRRRTSPRAAGGAAASAGSPSSGRPSILLVGVVPIVAEDATEGNRSARGVEEAQEKAVAEPVGQPLETRAALRVAADEVARPRLRRRQRVLDRLRNLVRRLAAPAGSGGGRAERRDRARIELAQLRGPPAGDLLRGLGALSPDRRRD